MAGLKAGAGRRVIQIPQEYLAVENFGVVHDSIHARAVAVCQEGNTNNQAAAAELKDAQCAAAAAEPENARKTDTLKTTGTVAETIILVSLEITSMPGEEVDAIRACIAEENKVKMENIWVCVTHSFSSPHLLPDHMFSSQEQLVLKEKYRKALQSAAAGAAADQAPIEKSVNETFANGQKIVSDQHEKGFEICARLSDIFKNRICEIAHEASFVQDEVPTRTLSASLTVPAKHMNRDLHSLRPTREAVYEPDGESETTIEAIRIGNLVLLGVKPELTCTTAASIMEQSGFDTTLVCTLVNGASKYMADESAYDRCCYEAQNSPFGRGAAEMLAQKAAAG